jgi:hypothetical protein
VSEQIIEIDRYVVFVCRDSHLRFSNVTAPAGRHFMASARVADIVA